MQCKRDNNMNRTLMKSEQMKVIYRWH